MMNIMKSTRFLAIVVTALLFSSALWAGTTGKIAGRVTDAKTHEALPGANVIIEGTTMGAAADVDGYFVILNVPPGTYTLTASVLGYQPMTIKNVRVEADRTTEVNFELSPTVAAKVKPVVVTAKVPTIRKDLTQSVAIVSSEEVRSLPVANVAEVVTQQAGVIARGGLHIRGGRPDEVVYVVDGVEIRDPYSNFTQASVPLLSVEETAISRGGFDVDQGSVSSGAINIVTREGGPRYDFEIRYQTSDLSFLPPNWYNFFDENKGDIYYDLVTNRNPDLSSPENRHKQKHRRTEIAFGGPLVPTWRKGAKFFVSADLPSDQGIYPISQNKDWRNWVNNYQWKVTIPFSSLKLFTSGFVRREMYRGYNPSWRFALDHTSPLKDRQTQIILGINHIISPKTYWELRSGWYDHEFKYNVPEDVDGDGVDDFDDRDLDGFVEIDKTYFEDSLGNLVDLDSLYPGWEDHGDYIEIPYYWWEDQVERLYPSIGSGPEWWSRDISGAWAPRNRAGWGQRSQPDIHILLLANGDTVTEISGKYYRFPFYGDLIPYMFGDTIPAVDTILKLGNQYLPNTHTWQRSQFYYGHSKTFTAKWRFQSQITEHHEILLGAEYKSIYIRRYAVDYASGGNVYFSFVNPPFQKREGDPYNFIDWFKDHETKPWTMAAYARDKIEVEGLVAKIGLRLDYYDPGGYTFGDSTNPFVRDSLWGPQGIRMLNKPVRSSKKWYISPRIGISHPISEMDVLHFTYGHYFQIPQFSQIISSYVFSGAFPIVGNANIDPEKTISYEVGIKHAFNEFFILDVTAFYKDIKDWTRLKQFPLGAGGENYSTYINEDYGEVRGLEFDFTKRPGGAFLPNLGLNVSYTYQVALGSFSSPFNAYDYMWRGYPLPPHESPLDWDQRHKLYLTLSYVTLGDAPLFGIKGLDHAGITIQHYVGSGFPYTPPIRTPREAIENINSERLPGTQTTNLRFYKDYNIGLARIRFFMDMFNVFNRKDLNSFDNVDWYVQFNDPEGERKNPTVWSNRRLTRVGLELKIKGF